MFLLCSAEREDSTAIGTGDLFVSITHRDDLLFITRLGLGHPIVEGRTVIFYQWKTLLNLDRAYTHLRNNTIGGGLLRLNSDGIFFTNCIYGGVD